jgi:hemolysin activation/secretion protein
MIWRFTLGGFMAGWVGVLTACLLCAQPALASDPPSAASPSSASAVVPEAKKETFDINEFRVLGNTVLPVKVIERAVYPYEGPRKTIEDVQAARAALEKAYHDAGYGTVFVDIPEQDVGPGIVRLRATEGRLDRVRVSGARYVSGRKLLAELPVAKEGAVPALPALQSQLSALNAESPDRSVTPVLKAGRTPGTVDLDLQVNDTLPLHGGVTLNDRYTPDTTRLRSTVDLSYGNLFQDYQSLAFEYQNAPERLDDERVFSLTYVAPLGFGRNLLALFAVDTHSNVAAVGALSLLGTGDVYGAHFIHPFADSGTYSQNLNFGADFKDFSQTVNVIGQAPDKTPIRYINWSLVYSLTHSTPAHDTSVNLGVDFGISGLPNDNNQFDFKRFGAQGDYIYLKGSVEQRQLLLLGMSLDARVGFQIADSPLVSNEQFGLGGIDTVRGYLESIELADSGVTTQLELRTPTWNFGPNPANNHIGGYLFYDNGYAWVVDPLASQQQTFTLESAGVGVRFIFFRGLDGMLEWADPLRTVSTVVRGHSRVEFQVHYGF